MPSPAVIGVDIGTSSSKGVLVDLDGRCSPRSVVEHAVQRPVPACSRWTGGVVGRVRRARAAPARGAAPPRSGGRRQRHGPVRAAHRRGDGAAAPGDPLRRRHARRPPDRAAERRATAPRRSCAAAARRCPRRPRAPRWRGSPTRSRSLRAGAAAVHAELVPRAPADRRVRARPPLRQPVHAALRLARRRLVPAVGRRDRRRRSSSRRCSWPGDAAGTVTADAAAATGLPEGIPVITGTIDAWSEALSVGAQSVGDLMLMYGTTMFLVAHGAGAADQPGAVGDRRRPPGHPQPRRRDGDLRRDHGLAARALRLAGLRRAARAGRSAPASARTGC